MSVYSGALRSLLILALFFIIPAALAQSAGTIGIGVKGGDPTGLSVKFYRPSAAIELVVGRPYYFRGNYYDNDYYFSRFHNYSKYKNGSFDYRGFAAHNPVAIQIHFLKSKGTKSAKELSWYYGAGPQLRAHKFDYYYRYREYYGPDKDDFKWREGTDRYTNIDLGLDGVLGLEYTFSDLPISIFADGNIFLELVDEISLSLQGGLGVRYNLK